MGGLLVYHALLRTVVLELGRAGGIRLFNQNKAKRQCMFNHNTMRFLPSAVNVKVIKCNETRLNGGSNYDSLKVAKCLVI